MRTFLEPVPCPRKCTDAQDVSAGSIGEHCVTRIQATSVSYARGTVSWDCDLEKETLEMLRLERVGGQKPRWVKSASAS